MSVSEIAAALGLEVWRMGGNCRAYGRPLPGGGWIQVHRPDDDLTLPTSAGEAVVVHWFTGHVPSRPHDRPSEAPTVSRASTMATLGRDGLPDDPPGGWPT